MDVDAQYSWVTWSKLHSQISVKAGIKTHIHSDMEAIRENAEPDAGQAHVQN